MPDKSATSRLPLQRSYVWQCLQLQLLQSYSLVVVVVDVVVDVVVVVVVVVLVVELLLLGLRRITTCVRLRIGCSLISASEEFLLPTVGCATSAGSLYCATPRGLEPRELLRTKPSSFVSVAVFRRRVVASFDAATR